MNVTSINDALKDLMHVRPTSLDALEDLMPIYPFVVGAKGLEAALVVGAEARREGLEPMLGSKLSLELQGKKEGKR